MKIPILGLYTAAYRVKDLNAQKAWYAGWLGIEPYFDEPFYVGFNVAGCELGLLPLEDGEEKVHGVLCYWGVPDIVAACQSLEGSGGKSHEPVTDVGGGIKTASFLDPEGNLIGLIENPHFPNTAPPGATH